MASACLYFFFAKPNLTVNTDLLTILCNYFSLICKAEILYLPQFYLKRKVLIQGPWLPHTYSTNYLHPISMMLLGFGDLDDLSLQVMNIYIFWKLNIIVSHIHPHACGVLPSNFDMITVSFTKLSHTSRITVPIHNEFHRR